MSGMTHTTHMIQMTNVTMSFGALSVLRGVSLQVAAGEAVALCGTNGAGKSTLIQCVTGVHRCGGSISIVGCDVARQGKSARRLLGYVPQELAFRDDMRVDEVVRFHAALRGLRRVDVRAVLRTVELDEHDRAKSRVLSGGMKQRLALAIALLGDPPVLVLDELSASLDVEGRSAFLQLLVGLRGEGRTVLFASHRPEEVQILAGRVAWIEHGRIVERATTATGLGSSVPADRGSALKGGDHVAQLAPA